MSRCWKLGDNVSTDELLPAQYMVLTDPRELSRHLLANVDPDFAGKLAAGDLLVAGSNFGCGSSREQAPLALKGAGIAAVIARSFSRIFFRNCLNLGIAALVSPQAVEGLNDGDEAEIDLERGVVITGSSIHRFEPFPPFLLEYLRAGGLIEAINKKNSATQY